MPKNTQDAPRHASQARAPAADAAAQEVCPQCGGPMLEDRVPERRELVRAMVQNGSPAPYATNFADAVHEKTERDGRVFTCVRCRYVTRIKSGASAERETAA